MVGKAKQVVAAIIQREDRILIAQRGDQHGFPNKWEFPGGKIQQGEDEVAALVRELREELEIEVDVGDLFVRVDHSYDEFDVSIAFYVCRMKEGVEPMNRVHRQLKWVTVADLNEYEFLEANVAILRLLEKKIA